MFLWVVDFFFWCSRLRRTASSRWFLYLGVANTVNIQSIVESTFFIRNIAGGRIAGGPDRRCLVGLPPLDEFEPPDPRLCPCDLTGKRCGAGVFSCYGRGFRPVHFDHVAGKGCSSLSSIDSMVSSIVGFGAAADHRLLRRVGDGASAAPVCLWKLSNPCRPCRPYPPAACRAHPSARVDRRPSPR